jgi:hypothetical protein
VFLGVLMAAAQFLAEVPVVEQGYPSDTVSLHAPFASVHMSAGSASDILL